METLYNIVKSLRGCTFAKIVTKTIIKDSKVKSLGLGEVTALVEANVQLNYSYQNAVNNRLRAQGSEGKFTAKSLPWGTWEVENKIISHNGKHYLRYYKTNNNAPKITYYINGIEADRETAALIIEALKKSPKKSQSEAGLTENQVYPLVVAFENIKELHVSGQIYKARG